MVPEFEPTTFQTRAVTHNHLKKVPWLLGSNISLKIRIRKVEIRKLAMNCGRDAEQSRDIQLGETFRKRRYLHSIAAHQWRCFLVSHVWRSTGGAYLTSFNNKGFEKFC